MESQLAPMTRRAHPRLSCEPNSIPRRVVTRYQKRSLLPIHAGVIRSRSTSRLRVMVTIVIMAV